MTSLFAFTEYLEALFGFALVLPATQWGWQRGIRAKRHGTNNNISIVEQCLFGLLALLIGFTFLMALSRFEARREALIDEANAIGTAALRARLLAEPHRVETLKLLREYVGLRVEAGPTVIGKSSPIIQRTDEIQEALWQHAKAAAIKDNRMVPTGLFIQALNEMIDRRGKRLGELLTKIPEILLLTLFATTAVSGAVAGYAAALEERRSRWQALIMGILACAVIFVTMDIDQPGSGFTRVSQQPMIDAAASIANFTD
jgi:hypothetical protein